MEENHSMPLVLIKEEIDLEDVIIKEENVVMEHINENEQLQSSLNLHIKAIHFDEKPFSCEICDKRFITRQNLITHQRTHTREKPFSCEICGNKFSHQSSLVRHKRIHIRENLAHEVFEEKIDLIKEEIIDVDESSVLDFDHEKLEENLMKNEVIAVENEQINEEINLDQILIKEEILAENNIVQHELISDQDETDKLDHKLKLETENALKSQQNKPYSCDFCDKRFKHRVNLSIHKRLHSGKRPFSLTLDAHKAIHRGERNYSCDMCGKRYFHYDSLTVHKRIHGVERSYPCEICDKRFIRRQDSSLVRHKKIHIQDNLAQHKLISYQDEIDKLQHKSCKFEENLTENEINAVENVQIKEEINLDQILIKEEILEGNNIVQHELISDQDEIDKLEHKSNQNETVKLDHKLKLEAKNALKSQQNKPYSCEFCDKRFKRRVNLSIHKRLHSGKRPFSRNLCNKLLL
ncbi:zinc finger protein 600-like [Chrysoperla carnea]|uniref:zinc finger protein 600-like n=1 Tax=Chrysoperla carnea TaxID=189513 RepID=UPI001D07CDEA|nr:zinc finger protein 600-like [Chrysoperla carnea]